MDARIPLVALLGACGEGDAPPECAALAFVPDVPGAKGEQYVCFGFDADPLEGRPIGTIALETPSASAVALHHVALYAASGSWPAEPVEDCERMPEGAVELNVWAPGGEPLELPAGVGLALPPDSTRLVVQVHALRAEPGPPAQSSLRVCAAMEVDRLAAWLPARAPVPAIRPGFEETTIGTCRIDSDLHLHSTWPHMHRIGTEFHGTVLRAEGTRERLVDVVPWTFEEQRAYPLDVDLYAGDTVETSCTWRNDSGEYVLPGPKSSDEMCGQSLIAWPAEAASCAP